MRISPSLPNSGGWVSSERRPRPMSPDASSAVVERAPHTEMRGGAMWLLALIPVVLLAALLAAIIGLGPTRLIQGNGAPPVERLVVTRVDLVPGEMRLSIVNDGPD